MEIKTIFDVIEWSREQHLKLATCLAHCAPLHDDERASLLLGYLASHETEIETMVAKFATGADANALDTYVYDYLPHTPITTYLECDKHYASMNAEAITEEVFSFHEQIISLYQSLLGKAEIAQAKELVQSLLSMEEHETRRLVRQVERMNDL